MRILKLQVWAACLAAGAVDAPLGAAPAPPSRAVIAQIARGDCGSAVKIANDNFESDEPQLALLVGRMLDEGICTARDPAAALGYFARASALGAHAAAADYAAKIGLGEGAEQSYERAGEICQGAGLDPQRRLSRYSLGYACTVASVAAEQLRTSLPRGSFQPGGVVLVELTPADAGVRIRTTPPVALSDAAIGSNVRRPLIDAQREVTRALRDALTVVPRPDPARLDKLPVEVPLDVDMTLETTAAPRPGSPGVRLPGDIVPRAYRQGE